MEEKRTESSQKVSQHWIGLDAIRFTALIILLQKNKLIIWNLVAVGLKRFTNGYWYRYDLKKDFKENKEELEFRFILM